MEQTQPRFFQDRWNATDRVYKFKNGSTVQFDSFESVSKAKAAGKRTHLFINEANHIPFPIADALMMRTSEDIWIDFNPDNEFWVHTELIGNDDVDFIILNYKDNEALPLSILQDLMQKQEKAKASKYWENWCKVYIDGEVGQLEGVVFENWEIIDKIPDGARMEAFGIDFGYTNDPSTGVGYWKWNGKRIFDEMFYETGLSNGNIADLLKENKISRIQYGVADSAEPKSIDEINRRGFTIKGSTKGKDSINFGIGLLQEEKFYVTARSVNMIKELRKYRWDTDREGNKLNRPIDAFNHCIDPMRYIAVEKFGKPTKHTRIIV